MRLLRNERAEAAQKVLFEREIEPLRLITAYAPIGRDLEPSVHRFDR